MVITDYRIQSVLRTYGRQLQRSKLSDKLAPEEKDSRMPTETVSISDEARRRMIVDHMTSHVLERTYPKQEDSAKEAVS